MQTSRIFSNGLCSSPAAKHNIKTTLLGLLVALGFGLTLGRAQQTDNDTADAQVLTRGPVHEAFAGIVTFNPEPGIVVAKAPPDVIEEVPPEERPEGDNVAWIPGYWAWDDERSDFLWISGTWRALPPGREWMAGYWSQTAQGHQWISGYWADAKTTETTYLPEPPATVEAGPNIAAPSEDYSWTPGCWLWYRGRYAWRPGYWTEGRADWDWIPANYVWTPRGYLFVEGYWDYPVERRGILFAPVYFESGVYSRRGYHYAPSIVINLDVFSDHLFLRPSYHHYYFGDYYAASYAAGGIYASYSFQSSRHGYDPFYSRQRWEHRQDREWEHRVAVSYQYRRDNESARPPRTWVAQRNTVTSSVEISQNRMQVALSINQLATKKDRPMHLQPVAKDERQTLEHRGQDVQQSREQRRTLEAQPAATTSRSLDKRVEPAKVQLPRSPIVAKPLNELGKNQTPPQVPKAPKPDAKLQPKSETPGRQPNQDRGNQPAERRQPTAEKKSEPSAANATPQTKPIQPEPQPRGSNPGAKVEKDPQRNTQDKETKVQQDTERRAKDAAAKTAEDSQRSTRELEKKTQQESEQRAKTLDLKAQEDAQRNARAIEEKARQESEQRAKVSAVRAQEESQRSKQESEEKARKKPVPPVKKQPVVNEKDSTNREKRNPEKDDKKRPDDSPAP